MSTTLTEVFTDIASAINAKGVSGSMKPTEMAEKIEAIPSGGGSDGKITKNNVIDYESSVIVEA